MVGHYHLIFIYLAIIYCTFVTCQAPSRHQVHRPHRTIVLTLICPHSGLHCTVQSHFLHPVQVALARVAVKSLKCGQGNVS